MGKKGLRSSEGQGEIWDEPKTVVVSVKLTPTGKRLLDEKAQFYGISKGELIERVARGSIEPPATAAASLVPDSSSIIAALSRYPRAQLVQIAWTALTLLIGGPNNQTGSLRDERHKNSSPGATSDR